MLGPTKPRRLVAEPIAVSLDERIPASLSYRHLEANLDAEPEAPHGRNRMGPASRSLWEPRGPPEGVMEAVSRLRMITDPAVDRAGESDPAWSPTTGPAAGLALRVGSCSSAGTAC